MSFPKEAVAALTAKFPRSAGKGGVGFYKYVYGTAGFRDAHEVLDSALARVGLLAALQSIKENGALIGVMVTASHNLGGDNGAKITNAHGEMMGQSWEDFATVLANAPEGPEAADALAKFAADLGIDWAKAAKPRVVVGIDTRDSSKRLENCVIEGAKALGAVVYQVGLCTTPQLHWIVQYYNANPALAVDTAEGLKKYYATLSDAFLTVLPDEEKSSPVLLTVDCANGVGTVSLGEFSKLVDKRLKLSSINTAIDDVKVLNVDAGAEHVQKTKTAPKGVSLSGEHDGVRFASIDGDADRLVFFFVQKGEFVLLDGDKIIALVASFIKGLLGKAGLDKEITVGVVQTAYANGASTDYISAKIGAEIAFVPTGVKYLHHRAVEFDIGVYFEANGHGTVVFSKKAKDAIEAKAKAGDVFGKKLHSLTYLINQAVGDAISDLLLVEAVLANLKLSFSDWDKFYSDLPSIQSKVKVADRLAIKTYDAERKVSAPAGLQAEIDETVKKVGGAKGRAFVRPSGTEDVVRVYAEAETKELTVALARAVEAVVKKYCA